MCGDFNATVDSEVLAELLRRDLRDAYAGVEDAFTCNAKARRKRIDFILHDTAFTSTPAPIKAIENETPLPSEHEPSDHLAIAATLVSE